MDGLRYLWLGGFIVLIAAYYLIKEPFRKRAADVLLAFAAIFVVVQMSHIFSHHGEKLTKSAPTISSDQVELMLKLVPALSALPGVGSSDSRTHEMVKTAEKQLQEAVKKEPDSAVLAAKEALVCHEAHDPVTEPLQRLAKLKSQEAHDLSLALNTVYSSRAGSHKFDGGSLEAFEKTYKTYLPFGWFQDVALMELYRAAGQEARFRSLHEQFENRCQLAFQRLVAIVVIAVLAGLIGVIAVTVQTFFLPRNLSTPESLQMIRAPQDYGKKAVFGVFIGWLAAQSMVGLLLQQSTKQLVSVNGHTNPLLAAFATALIYAFSMGPALLFMWLFAFKPHKISFLEGIKFRLKVNKLGPGKMILIGMVTWCAALPLVALSYLVAVRFFHSQGSSNPIIALVMEASRTANFNVAIIIFVMLAVMAPICEESLFRGFLYSYLRRTQNVPVSMVLSACAFAGVHLDPGGFLPLFSLGLVFAFVFERTKTIVPAIIAHGMWNAGTFSMILLLISS